MPEWGILIASLCGKEDEVKQAYFKRNANIRMVTKGKFKFRKVLASQREFDTRVKELQRMIEDICGTSG